MAPRKEKLMSQHDSGPCESPDSYLDFSPAEDASQWLQHVRSGKFPLTRCRWQNGQRKELQNSSCLTVCLKGFVNSTLKRCGDQTGRSLLLSPLEIVWNICFFKTWDETVPGDKEFEVLIGQCCVFFGSFFFFLPKQCFDKYRDQQGAEWLLLRLPSECKQTLFKTHFRSHIDL